jgi:hypothetical protein
MTTFLVFAGIALLVVGYLAFDWWMAGRKAKRQVGSARESNKDNAGVGYAAVERNTNAAQYQTWTL